VAATRTAKNRSGRNGAPDTPDVSESKIARMKVDELRRRLADHGVEDVAGLKKPDLVQKLVKAEAGGRKRAGTKPATAKSAAAKKSVSAEGGYAGMKADELRRLLKERGVKGTAGMKKAELVENLSKDDGGDRRSGGKGGGGVRKGGGGVRKGKATSGSVKYAQEITSPDDEPERAGRSLVTTDHEVIRRWAEARGATPATVAGTEHEGHLGVLRFDFPGYGGDRLTEVSWEDWFRTFDERRLNFVFQDTLASGETSNFFRLDNPER
jgi:hypothetical protein